MAVRLDDDVRQLAEEIQKRRNAARKRVADQEIIGMRFLGEDNVRERMESNLEDLTLKEEGGEQGLRSLADTAAYGLEMLRRREAATAAEGGL